MRRRLLVPSASGQNRPVHNITRSTHLTRINDETPAKVRAVCLVSHSQCNQKDTLVGHIVATRLSARPKIEPCLSRVRLNNRGVTEFC